MDERCLWPGATGTALDRYRRHVHDPGRLSIVDVKHLWPGAVSLARDREQRVPEPGPFPVAPCRCAGCGLLAARDTLGEAMRYLPDGARRELARLVAPLDARLLRRTAHDSRGEPACPWVAEDWWWQMRS